jgi:hypothetical protein
MNTIMSYVMSGVLGLITAGIIIMIILKIILWVNKKAVVNQAIPKMLKQPDMLKLDGIDFKEQTKEQLRANKPEGVKKSLWLFGKKKPKEDKNIYEKPINPQPIIQPIKEVIEPSIPEPEKTAEEIMEERIKEMERKLRLKEQREKFEELERKLNEKKDNNPSGKEETKKEEQVKGLIDEVKEEITQKEVISPQIEEKYKHENIYAPLEETKESLEEENEP